MGVRLTPLLIERRKHAAKTAARSLRVGGPSLKQIRISLVDLDKTGEGFDAKVGERHNAIVARAIDPDQSVLLIHFVGDVPQPVLVLAEHFSDEGNGADMMNLVDGGQGQAAAANMADSLGVQFHGNRSSSRWAGYIAIRARTSASQACGSTSFILAVTMRLYMAAARLPPRSDPQNNHDFLPRAMPRRARSAALFDRHTRPSSRNRVKAAQRLRI